MYLCSHQSLAPLFLAGNALNSCTTEELVDDDDHDEGDEGDDDDHDGGDEGDEGDDDDDDDEGDDDDEKLPKQKVPTSCNQYYF